MIIQCANCSKRFIVRDKDIPSKGRVVKCGFCSTTWHQKPATKKMPIVERKEKAEPTIDNNPTINENDNFNNDSSNLGINKKASDGKTYKFLGSQWAVLLPSGKTGIFAKKKITRELNKLIGRQENYDAKPLKKFDPSTDAIDSDSRLPDIYKSKSGIGFFSYVFLIIILSFSAVGIIKTFEDDWLSYFPQDQHIFDLIDEQLGYVNETIKNIIIIIEDLINSY
jgi:predicted Zn finger-like uncharacterized protein